MRIFISYKTDEAKKLAEAINLCLLSDGHNVFFDKDDLPVGGTFDNRIREAIQDADLFIFLISPGAIEEGSYTLTELDFAQKKWNNPDGFILPVLVTPTDYDAIPSYLKAVNILEPRGNAAAEVCGAVIEISNLNKRAKKVIPFQKNSTSLSTFLLSILIVGIVGVTFLIINYHARISSLESENTSLQERHERFYDDIDREFRVLMSSLDRLVSSTTELNDKVSELEAFLNVDSLNEFSSESMTQKVTVYADSIQALNNRIVTTADFYREVMRPLIREDLNFTGEEMKGVLSWVRRNIHGLIFIMVILITIIITLSISNWVLRKRLRQSRQVN